LARLIKKMRDHAGENNFTEVEKYLSTERWRCGITRTVDSKPKCAQSWNSIQTLKECLCCHIYCTQLRAHLGKIVGASCAVSNRESRYPRGSSVIVKHSFVSSSSSLLKFSINILLSPLPREESPGPYIDFQISV